MDPSSDRSIVVRNVVIGLVIFAGVVAAVIYWSGGSLIGPWQPAVSDEESEPITPSTTAGEFAPPETGDADAPPETPAAASESERRWTELMGRPPVWPGDLAEAPGCAEADRGLAEICKLLDARSDDLERFGGACNLIEEVGEELAGRPPRTVAELRSHDTLVSNVFHLFRVLGRERTRVLKRTLDTEDELTEPAALALYRWIRSRETCRSESPSSIRMEPLYEYAAFLFNTMGGQAYLRRRPPRIESLACFYGLQVLDVAVERGHNPLGLDPRPEIARCRDLVRGQSFVFVDRYVEILDDMDRRWQRR
jgi:hypothetical protein